jgi:DNA-binding response OmpR family regulator
VLIVSGAQWPRALLRAQLLEEGYDAVGARTLASALGVRTEEPARGPVRLIVLDQAVLETEPADRLDRLRARHPGAQVLLLARSTVAPPPGDWDGVLRRPLEIAELVAAVRRLVSFE